MAGDRDVAAGVLGACVARRAGTGLTAAEQVLLITQDGRVILGTLRGFDAVGSIILSGCVERIFSADAGVEEVPLGLYILRGDSMCVARRACVWLTVQCAARRRGPGQGSLGRLGVAPGRPIAAHQTFVKRRWGRPSTSRAPSMPCLAPRTCRSIPYCIATHMLRKKVIRRSV